MSGEELRQEYERRLSDLKNMKDRIAISLQQSISHKKIPFDAVNGRVKEFDSFMEKSRRKNFQNPFLEVNDIVGIRVICLYRDDIEKIKNVVRDTFEVISDDDKTDSKESDRFGYSGSHIIARLGNKQNASLPRVCVICVLKYRSERSPSMLGHPFPITFFTKYLIKHPKIYMLLVPSFMWPTLTSYC